MKYNARFFATQAATQIVKLALQSLILTILVVLISNSILAQQVNYKITTDDPTDVHKLSISLVPFYVDAWSPNTTMGWGLEGRFLLTKRISVMGNYYSSYFQINDYEGNDSPSKMSRVEAIGQFAFSAKPKKVPLKVILKSSSDGAYSYTKYIMVDGEQMRKWNLRFGAGYFGSPYSVNNARTEQVLSTTGTPASQDVMGTMTTSGLIFGISREKYSNLLIQTGDKEKGNGKFSSFYFDFMYNPVLNVNDINFKGQIYEVSEGDNGIELKNTGWRIGYDMYTKMNKPVDLTMRFEVGSRPGFKGKGFYALLSFGMGLHFL